jgi:hypothetical protein
MNKAERIAQIEKVRKRYIKAFRGAVTNALKQQYGHYVFWLREKGPQYVLAHPEGNLIDGVMPKVIETIYVKAGIAMASVTYRELKRLPKKEQKAFNLGFNAQWTAAIINYFQMNLFNKVVLPIAQTTQDYIFRVLSNGIAEGWSYERMVEEINRKDYLNGRVERILRTEVNRAVNYGQQVASDSYEYKTNKRWLSVHDERTRHPHLDADGQTVAVNGMFNVGGEELEFPGDPSAKPENTINCRCVEEIVPLRDGDGRLILKESDKNPPISNTLRRELEAIVRDLRT